MVGRHDEGAHHTQWPDLRDIGLARRADGVDGIEVEGLPDTDLPALKRLGCTTEIVAWRTRVFVPGAAVLERLLDRWPLGESAHAA